MSAHFIFTLNNIAAWILIASLKTLPLIAFIFIVQRLLRKVLSAFSKHLLWLSVLISLSIPFGWSLQFGNLPTQDSPANILHLDQVITVITPEQTAVKPDNLPALIQNTENIHANKWQILTYNLHTFLAFIWLSGILIFLCLTLFRARDFQRVKDRAIKASPNITTLFHLCQTEIGVTKTIQLLSTTEIQSPITLGWLKPAIVLPKNLELHVSPEILKHVLLHELGHIKRQDILFNWIVCLINILHWFNPIVWLACRRMRMDMEMACDALVLSHLDQSQRKHYGATLIKISEIPRVSPRAITTVGILENHTELKERLTMIKEFTVMNIRNTVMFGTILMATAITSFAQPNTQSQEKPSSTQVEHKSDKQQTEAYTTLSELALQAEVDLKATILIGQYGEVKIQKSGNNHIQNYGQLLTQLNINGFTAFKSQDYIQIIPNREARNVSIPTVEKNKTYYEDEYVTDYLKTEKACPASVLPAIRPLVPQYGFLSVHEGSRMLIIVDTYGNIQRVKAAIKAIESNLDKSENCDSNNSTKKK